MRGEHMFRDNTDEYDERKDTEVISELDRLRVQLAGCSLAATGNVDDASLAQPGDYGYSKAYEEILALRREYESLRASHAGLMTQLQSIFQQVTNGRVCYFGDHTGYEPQFSTSQVCQWDAALEAARKVGA